MHRASVQARFALSSRRRRPPRSSSPQEVHGVKPPRSTLRRCCADCDQSPSEGSRQRSSAGALELSPPTVIRWILTSGAGRHVVCASQHPAEHSCSAGPHCSSALDPQREPPGPLIVLDSQRGGLDRIRELLQWIVGRREHRSDRCRHLVFFAALRRPQIRPQNSLPFGARPLKMSLGTLSHFQPDNGVGWGSTEFQAGLEWGSLAGASRRGFFCHRHQATPP
ncbi:hypothetical protein NDU88_005599 [Pleurodeles waltl]|uniref:Uncharacterized protein n=1 Tax=Pleurodeles waltl TaxID=8319 RepID=A0AAV7TUT1_PLEWA|nr:hypothetical protein NDU88_005599 [Pleurodeles waltl]